MKDTYAIFNYDPLNTGDSYGKPAAVCFNAKSFIQYSAANGIV